jgi:cold shock protein
MNQQNIYQGAIKRLFADKNYGFITPNDGSGDVFFHFSQYSGNKDDLKEGTKVSFQVTRGPKGRQASGVQIIE